MRPTGRQLGKNGGVLHPFLYLHGAASKCLHILWFLHFTGNRNEALRIDENFDRQCNIRNLS